MPDSDIWSYGSPGNHVMWKDPERDWSSRASRYECEFAISNRTSPTDDLHCPPQWEAHVNLCWPPGLPGFMVEVPCPTHAPYGYFNPSQAVSRVCQRGGQWWVNASFDDNPYSDYRDCFLPIHRTSDDELKQWVNDKTFEILRTLAAHQGPYFLLHGVDMFVLLVGLCCSLVFLHKTPHPMNRYRYTIVAGAASALLLHHATMLLMYVFYETPTVIKCQVSKTILALTNIVFCNALLGYVFVCMFTILDYKFSKRKVNILLLFLLIFALLLVAVEVGSEAVKGNSHQCGIGTLQVMFHWMVTAPKFFVIACTIVVTGVAIYGVYALPQTHLLKHGQMRNLKVSTICVLILTIYNSVCEILLILLHTVASVENNTLFFYTHAYSAVDATRGTVLIVLLCICDPETCQIIMCHNKRKPNKKAPKKRSLSTSWSYPRSEDQRRSLVIEEELTSSGGGAVVKDWL